MKEKCDYCGCEYDSDPTFTDQDRLEEYRENFPNDPNMEEARASICEDCYILFKKWLDTLTPEEREKIESDGS